MATQLREQALLLYESLNDLRGVAWCRIIPPNDLAKSVEKSLEHYHKTLDMMRELHDLSGQLMILNRMGLFFMELGDYKQSEFYFKASIVIAQQIGDKRHETTTLGNLGELALRHGKLTLSRKISIKCLTLAREIDHWYTLYDMLWVCVALLFELDNMEASMTLFGAIISREHLTGQQIHPTQINFITSYVDHLQHKKQLSSVYQTHYDIGYKMLLDEATQFALSTLTDECRTSG